jgi:hypothetical protein
MRIRLLYALIVLLAFGAGYTTASLRSLASKPWLSLGCAQPGETLQNSGGQGPWPARPLRPGF